MKSIYKLLFIIIALVGTTTSCNDEQQVTPSDITNLSAEPSEGGVTLSWIVPEDANFLYVKIEYQNPLTGEKHWKIVSTHANSILITGLLAKEGEYQFNVQTVSNTKDKGTNNVITCTALPVQPILTKITEKVNLTATDLSTNAQEPTQGPIEDLVDGNLNNFFHTRWSGDAITEPHYIDMKLPSAIDQFEYITWSRPGYGDGSQSPIDITLLGSNDGTNWEEIIKLTDDKSNGAKYESPVIKCDKSYTHLRYRADKVNNVAKGCFSLAELQLNKVWFEVYDPEGIYQPEE